MEFTVPWGLCCVSVGIDSTGLNANPSGTYANADYSFHVTTSTNNIYENGVNTGVNVAVWTSSNDVWKVELDGGNVNYYLNGNLVQTSSGASGNYYIVGAIDRNTHSITGDQTVNTHNNILSATSLSDNTVTPQHYSFTKDSSNNWNIYQNGVSVATAVDTTGLGASGSTLTTKLDGTLDEFFIDSTALSSTDITNIASRGAIPSPYTVTGTTFNDGTVLAGSSYTYKVSAVNSIGESGYSNTDTAMTVSPANAPTGLTVSSNAQAQLVLNWTPSTDLGGGSLLSMDIQRSTDGGATWQLLANPSNTSPPYIDQSTVAGNSYTYKIASVNEAGVGVYSNVVTSTAGTPPDAILDLVGIIADPNLQPHDVQLTFSEPLNWGTGIPVSYEVFDSLDGITWSSVSTPAYVGGIFTTTPSISNIQPNTNYYYKVTAVSNHGTSLDSNIIMVTTPNVPDQPIAPTVTIFDPDNAPLDVTVSYVAPPDNGSAIKGYQIDRWDGSKWETITPNTGVVDTNYHDLTVLPASDYKYRVSAINPLGVSSSWNIDGSNYNSNNILTYANGQLSGVGSIVSDNPVSEFTYIYDSTVGEHGIGFDRGGSSITPTYLEAEYLIKFNSGGVLNRMMYHSYGDWGNTNNNDGDSGLNSIFTGDVITVGVDSSGNVTVKINGVLNKTFTNISPAPLSLFMYATTDNTPNVTFNSPHETNSIYDSSIISTPTVPDTPTGLTVTTDSTTQLTLDWSIPNSGGSMIQGYLVQEEQPIGSGNWVQIASVNTNSYVFTGTVGAEFNFKVSAFNNVGTGAFSGTASGWTLPDAVGNLQVLTISGDQLNITFDTPAHTVTEYLVYRDGILVNTISYTTACTPACVIPDTGLSSGTNYNYHLVSNNLGGSSVDSNMVDGWTLADPPSNLTLTTDPNTANTINLNWNAPSGTTTGYQIDRDDGNGWVNIVSDTQSLATIYDDGQLQLSSSYSYRIASINLGGIGMFGNVASLTTLSPPDPPTNIEFDLQDISGLRVQISWTEPVNLSGGTLSGYLVEKNTDGAGWSILTNSGTTPSIVDLDIQRGVNYEYRTSATTQIGTGLPSVSNSFEFVDGTFNLPLTAVQGNTLESISSFTKTFGDPDTYATKIVIVRHDNDNNAITTTASVADLTLSNSTTISNGNSLGILLSGATTQLDTQYVYETSEFTYTGYLTTVQDGVEHIFASSSSTVTPLNPFGGDTFANEFRDELTYQTSTVELYAEPAGYDAVIRYQHQDPNVTPFFYAFENIQANNTSVSPVLEDTDFYVSVYINPTEFDFVIDNATSGLAHVECNEESPKTCPAWDSIRTPAGELVYSLNPTYGEIEDIPSGIQSDFVTKSFKSPDSINQLGLEPLGDLFGMPMVFIFVIGLGAVFTGRSAQMGVIFIAVTIGIMIYMGYLSFDFGSSGISTAVTWGIIIIAMIGGLFVGKRWS